MNLHPHLASVAASRDRTRGIVKIAVLAVGGQGGGVLTNWIIELARRGGFRAQATSVAGVAQRTGSTIYYVEMAPDEGSDGRMPVFALSPAPGDVDIVIAAELMEAGRAIMRGFVTPDRTTLIASTHRVLATVEKVVPGDGRAASAPILEQVQKASHRAICLDLDAAAEAAGSVISASLFGALAGSGALPFDRALYEETIAASGRGVGPSLAAFAAGWAGAAAHAAEAGEAEAGDAETGSAAEGSAAEGCAAPLSLRGAPRPTPAPDPVAEPVGRAQDLTGWRALCDRLALLPGPVRPMARRGLAKVVDYQDLAYGSEYLDLLHRAVAADEDARGWTFSQEAAKHVANALCYDDLIRVADLKTRATREARLRREQGAQADQIVQVTEYFHPRAAEACSILPASLGAWIEARPRVVAWLGRRVDKGRRLRTDTLRGWLSLWLVAGLKPVRRRLLRHRVERAHLEQWLNRALRAGAADHALGVEVLRCRRLIKGYSDTHARGLSKYAKIMDALDMLQGRGDAAEWLARLRQAALRDEKGDELAGALQTIESFRDTAGAKAG